MEKSSFFQKKFSLQTWSNIEKWVILSRFFIEKMFTLWQRYVKIRRAAEKFGNENFKTCRFSKNIFCAKKTFSRAQHAVWSWRSILQYSTNMVLFGSRNSFKLHEKSWKASFHPHICSQHVFGSYLYLGTDRKVFSIFLRFSEAKSTVVNPSKKRVFLARAECKYRPYRQC